MVAAAYFASRRTPEQLLLLIDAAAYSVCAAWAVHVAITNNQHNNNDDKDDDDEEVDSSAIAVQSLAVFLAVTVAPAAWRHLRTARAACKRACVAAYGNVKTPVCAYDESATPAPAVPYLQYVPAASIVLAALWLFAVGGAPSSSSSSSSSSSRVVPLVVLLVASWVHFGGARVHGDQRGGKVVPTYFAIMLHLAAAVSGTSSRAAISLHRILIMYTYLMTGFRKVYCTGFRWADGKNLQLMLGVQGLYHDLDADPRGLGFNFALAEHRGLCFLGSVSVLGLQLLMPIFLLVPSPAVFAAAFWLAWSFHAGNHVLWRINFFGSWCPALLALIVPGEQLGIAELWAECRSGRAAAPLVVLIVHLVMQLGHALDRLGEKLMERATREVIAATKMPELVRRPLLFFFWMIDLHFLGDYYTSYWPVSHVHRDNMPVACFVVKYEDGDEILLPAPVCFYWRRDVSVGVLWPSSVDDVDKAVARIAGEPVALTTAIARLRRQLEQSFLPESTLRRIEGDGARVFFRIRELRYDDGGTALRPVRLYDVPITLRYDIGNDDSKTKRTKLT